jgi:hypothetical protein
MPLTAKGEKIMASMVDKYGQEKGEEVFYRSKNAGTISGVDADETERDGEGLREQLRAAREGAMNARTSSAKASYRAECDKLEAKIADMERADMGHHVAGHVGKAASSPKSLKHADTPLARAEAAIADAVKRKDGPDEEQARREMRAIMTEGLGEAKEWREKFNKLSGGGREDASKDAGQDSPLAKLEAEIDEMKLHNKLGDAMMKHLDCIEEKIDALDGAAAAAALEQEEMAASGD